MTRTAVTVGIILMLALAPIVGVVGAEPTQDGENDGSSYGTEYEIGNDVSVWDRSIFPLRANTSDGQTVVSNQDLFISTSENREFDLRRGELAVFGAEEEVELEFDPVSPEADTTQYDGDDVRVIVGTLDEGTALSTFDQMPSVSDLNENASFTQAAETTIADGKFADDVTYTPDAPGAHVVLVTTYDEDGGLAVDGDGNLEPQGPSTIIGVESLFVQDSASSVDAPSSVEPGNNATFENVDDGLETDGDVAHTIVLYDESTIETTPVTINLTDSLDADFTMGDVVVEQPIGTVEGVVTVGETITGDETNRTPFDEVVDLVVGDLNESDSVDLGDDVLNASTTMVVANDSDETIDVATLEEWPEKEYRWIHVASTTDQVATSTGTLDVEEEETSPPGGGIPIAPPSPVPEPEPEPEPEPGENATFDVKKTTLSDTKIEAGESVDVKAIVENVGDVSGTFTAELIVDGEVVDEQDVDVDAGESETVTFTQTFDSPGTHTIAVNDASAGELVVTGPPPAEFDVTDATLSDTEIEAGESADVTATVENVGGQLGTFTAELIVDGEVVDEKSVTIGTGTEKTVSFTRQFEEAGEYEIEVSGTSAGTLTVAEEEDGGDGLPGFGAPMAIAAIAAALLALRTRSD
ncbi:CARDB domain-containing protein [Natribaculum luteum]|uniref:CARDB domain-containing protein n=1 Tax=Natribaculum luteum TaxID=1586232 RepID=A0ABD5NW98_9EURY|nr:CARDB domain-containing protein [Natribaculum luteum]